MGHELNSHDLELTEAQQAIYELAERILAYKPAKAEITFWGFASAMVPEDVQTRLRNSGFGELLLKDGDSLSIEDPSGYNRDLGLFVGNVDITGVHIRAYGWEENKWRPDPNGSKESPYVKHPGEKDWTRQLEISLYYSNATEKASQNVGVETSSREAGETPSMVRTVRAIAYFETGYEGHSRVSRDDFEEQVILEFVQLANEVFNARIE
ncbi:MAG TPA: hypothetical protein VMQ58_02120 [Candidatus Saccharimonadales bacterium]|nr:hypothetical protein [Candidatus Saccharimonadales bacterium]